jgi:hypothetical protein
MANEPLALAIRPPEAPDEDEFLTLCAALSASGRGRAFLAEYTRRNRQADTEALLAAIGQIETRLQADASAVQRLRDDLRMLLIAIRLARPEIDVGGAPTRAAKLSKLLDLLEQRLDAMADAQPAEGVAPHLAVVPKPEEPELPIPAPQSAPAPAIALIPVAAAEPETAPAESAPPAPPEVAETAVGAPPSGPLAAIMALSEDERLALFT